MGCFVIGEFVFIVACGCLHSSLLGATLAQALLLAIALQLPVYRAFTEELLLSYKRHIVTVIFVKGSEQEIG